MAQLLCSVVEQTNAQTQMPHHIFVRSGTINKHSQYQFPDGRDPEPEVRVGEQRRGSEEGRRPRRNRSREEEVRS